MLNYWLQHSVGWWLFRLVDGKTCNPGFRVPWPILVGFALATCPTASGIILWSLIAFRSAWMAGTWLQWATWFTHGVFMWEVLRHQRAMIGYAQWQTTIHVGIWARNKVSLWGPIMCTLKVQGHTMAFPGWFIFKFLFCFPKSKNTFPNTILLCSSNDISSRTRAIVNKNANTWLTNRSLWATYLPSSGRFSQSSGPVCQ